MRFLDAGGDANACEEQSLMDRLLGRIERSFRLHQPVAANEQSALLMAMGWRFDTDGYALSGKISPQLVQELIERGADVNVANQSEETALMGAAGTDHPEIVQKLLKHGARVEAADVQGWTALHWAAMTNSVRSIDLLQKSGANLNARDVQGNTSLMLAVTSRHEAAVRALLEYGAAAAITDNKSRTPLSVAKRLKCQNILVLLQHSGAQK